MPKGAADGEAYNPVCGDEVRVRLVWDVSGKMRMEHATRGCAVCRASAGLAAGAVAGKTREEALALAGTFEECLEKGEFGRLGGDFGVFDGHRMKAIVTAATTAMMRIFCELVRFISYGSRFF